MGAIGREIEVAATGLGLREALDSTEDSLTARYGRCERLDRLVPGSTLDAPGMWMMALSQEGRVLAARWDGGEGRLPDSIRRTFLHAKALSLKSGALWLAYEFSNFSELKAAEDQLL